MIRNYFVLCMLFSFLANAQPARNLIFHPSFKDSTVYLNDTYFKLKNGDSIQFETLKFYISTIEFFNNEKLVGKEENSFHLIDASDAKTLSIALKASANISFNKIKFNLGIDSITNSSGAFGGDLDPTAGMYWTWQNGYINFKLEGKSNLCKSRKNEFQFHLGGYQFPFNTLQSIVLTIPPLHNIDVTIDLEKFISNINLTSQYHIMSPGKEAVLLSKIISTCFNVQAK